MEYLIEIVDSIYSFMQTIVTGTYDFGMNAVRVVGYIKIAASFAYRYVFSLPDYIQIFGLITIVISIVYTIFGRTTGGNKVD